MRRRVALVLLGLVFAVAFVSSTLILQQQPAAPDTMYDWNGSTEPFTICESVGSIVTVGQSAHVGDQPMDPAAVAHCEEMARIPGAIGWSIVAVGFAAGVAFIVILWRSRRVRAGGEPISRAIRRPELPRTRQKVAR